MTAFPAITPSSLDFTAPQYPVKSNISLSGVTSRRIFGNRASNATISAEFQNISDIVATEVCNVWKNATGSISPIELPAVFFDGSGPALESFMADGGDGLAWHFSEPPTVRRSAPGLSTVSIRLEATRDSSGVPVLPIPPPPPPPPPPPSINEIIIWFDDESAQVFPAGAAVITGEITGGYLTTEHLGQTAYAPPPGTLDASGPNELGGGWVIDMPDDLTNGNFTIEGWTRSSTAAPPAGGRGSTGISLAWDESTSSISMQSNVFRLSAGLTAEHQVGCESRYETNNTQVYEQLFGTSVQGWKHLCYQRVGGEDIFHYHGVRLTQTDGDGSLPSPRPVTSDAYLVIGATNEATSGVALGQVRVSTGALYGTGTFTPPSIAFYEPPAPEPPAPVAPEGYYGDWTAQTYGFEADIYPSWWAS
jgi:hypothetical protein